MKCNNFRIAARGLIVQDNKLLFVSDEGKYWYPPGGRLEGNENLRSCVEREVYEETGLTVKTGPLLYVQECLDVRDNVHKIHFYFQTTLQKGSLSDDWCDEGGSVLYRQFFSFEEIKRQETILPRFLGTVDWSSTTTQTFDNPAPRHSLYQGCVLMQGFEMLNNAPEQYQSLLAYE
jgi:8-oxo-dGTP diphosphatase